MLSAHINAEELIAHCKDHPHLKLLEQDGKVATHPKIKGVYGEQDIPKYTLPPTGISKRSAYQLLHDEMELDGSPILNLASFVTTGMDEEANRLMAENINKNFVDFDEYPATQAIHTRCVSILADLWKVPKECKAIGTATIGSSEAIMLGGLAMKKRWQAKRKAENKDYYHPNVVFGANAQVALEKFARYFDVEARLIPVSEESNFVMDPKEAMKQVDENTIGIIVIFGSTYTGAFEDVQQMSDLLDEYKNKTGIDIPIHVDGASGAFIAPFAYPKLKWAFDVPRVMSINASGHKYGLVYPGLGWLLFRDEKLLPSELIFEMHYLGSAQSSYTLNFSRPAAPILGQMYNFLTLGFEGYQKIVNQDLANARMLSRVLEKTYFKILSVAHRPRAKTTAYEAAIESIKYEDHDPRRYERGLPVVAFRLSDTFKQEYPYVQQRWIQMLLRTRGWIVPNYNAPKNVEHIEMLRIVVRDTLSSDLVARLATDILEVTESLMNSKSDAVLLSVVADPEKAASTRIEETMGKVRPRQRRQSTYSKPC